MDKVESQGHRLSSYASSYSHNIKNSPKTPKKSTEKLSTRSSSKEESLSPHHLISGYNSYTSINSPSIAKENHTECVLKCTCKHSSFNSLRSPKQQQQQQQLIQTATGDKHVQKISKISCDAATSPNRFSQRSPQINLRLNHHDASMRNELRISDEKMIIAKTNASPRRLIATRNAATSPGLEMRKQLSPKQTCELLPKSPDPMTKSILEKSNSLGESRPSRPLRTTRSLSPRPPVRHQHAITVCDENDIVSVKISPNEDFEDESGEPKMPTNGTKKKYKAQSEQTSPNLNNFGTTFSYENCSNNKSTGCLVYVPSDPWMKMSDIGDSSKANGQHKSPKFSQETRSLSRGNLVSLNNDPWIWRNMPDSPSSTAVVKKSPKQEIYRQAKSFSVTKFDLPDNLSKSASKTDKSSSAKSLNRPKLQRCKSPIIVDDELAPFLADVPMSAACTCNAPAENLPQQQNLLSPRKDLLNKETTTAIVSSSQAPQPTKTFLNVTNSSLVQSRHSFSSISQKDDELQLNIRRLSEQIKKPVKSGGADFTDYLNQFRTTEAQKAKAAAIAAAAANRNAVDPVLETTC